MIDINYFELFQIEPEYSIDKNHLKSMYLQLQAANHPDRARDNTEKLRFLDQSTQINNGYKILMDDYLRAEHLLKINGKEITDENSKDLLSKEALETIWLRNEQIDQADSKESMFALEKDYLAKQEALISDLQASFADKNILKALELTVKLKYLTNLVKNIRFKIRDANN